MKGARGVRGGGRNYVNTEIVKFSKKKALTKNYF